LIFDESQQTIAYCKPPELEPTTPHTFTPLRNNIEKKGNTDQSLFASNASEIARAIDPILFFLRDLECKTL
jgi:hypothetical protein